MSVVLKIIIAVREYQVNWESPNLAMNERCPSKKAPGYIVNVIRYMKLMQNSIDDALFMFVWSFPSVLSAELASARM